MCCAASSRELRALGSSPRCLPWGGESAGSGADATEASSSFGRGSPAWKQLGVCEQVNGCRSCVSLYSQHHSTPERNEALLITLSNTNGCQKPALLQKPDSPCCVIEFVRNLECIGPNCKARERVILLGLQVGQTLSLTGGATGNLWGCGDLLCACRAHGYTRELITEGCSRDRVQHFSARSFTPQ